MFITRFGAGSPSLRSDGDGISRGIGGDDASRNNRRRAGIEHFQVAAIQRDGANVNEHLVLAERGYRPPVSFQRNPPASIFSSTTLRVVWEA